MGGHVEVDNPTPVMGQYQKYVKDLETKGGHSKEVNGDQLLEVILQEGAPSLRGRLAAAHHVFAHAGLTDVDAEFEQFTVDARRTPSGVFVAHPADQGADLAGNGGSSQFSTPDLPGPEEAEALAMPSHDRLRLNDSQRRGPVSRHPGQRDPEEAVQRCQRDALSSGTPKHSHLVPEGQVLQLKGSARTEDRGQSGKECRKNVQLPILLPMCNPS